MPFLRIIRDKRGYVTTYLMHWYRDGARQRSRILYVFRTPGGVRVGRDALDPAVLRSIEAQYPDIAFDWKAVIDNQQVVEPAIDYRRLRKRKRSDDDSGASAAAGPAGPAAGPAAAPEESAPGTAAGSASPQRPPIPATLQGATPDEQIAFLTIWYPAVRERIPPRFTDPIRQEALLAVAERLNPANWTDADQIAAGLVQAAEALERLSHVFSKRRRRSRRASKPSSPQTAAAAPERDAVDPAPPPESDVPSDL